MILLRNKNEPRENIISFHACVSLAISKDLTMKTMAYKQEKALSPLFLF